MISVSATTVEGRFAWPQDALFRPLVALYDKGRLAALAPSWRRPGADGWGCAFEIANPDIALGDLTVACLESGEQLWPRVPGDVRRVEDLLALGRAADAFAYGGFAHFLRLALEDQIRIFYRDLLGREAGEKEVEDYCARVAAGEISLLEIRDEIALSEEMTAQLVKHSREEKLGRWCLWQGLAHLQGVAGDSLPGREIGDILAYNAIGATSDIGLYARWRADHGAVTAAIAESQLNRDVDRTPRHYRLGNLLAAMTTGPAGMRQADGAVRHRAGAAGAMVFGPYMRLEPGRYRLNAAVTAQDAPVRLRMEAVHGDFLLGSCEAVLDGNANHSVTLAFARPSDCDLLDKDIFEFRLTADGGSLTGLALDVRRDGAVALAAPQVDNWQALLQLERAGRRTDAGLIAADDQGGRVFFGPYCTLLPGVYVLTVTCETAGEGVAALEVVAGAIQLGQAQVRMTPGENIIALPFEIPRPKDMEAMPRELEFRLDKDPGFSFLCRAVTVERTP